GRDCSLDETKKVYYEEITSDLPMVWEGWGEVGNVHRPLAGRAAHNQNSDDSGRAGSAPSGRVRREKSWPEMLGGPAIADIPRAGRRRPSSLYSLDRGHTDVRWHSVGTRPPGSGTLVPHP